MLSLIIEGNPEAITSRARSLGAVSVEVQPMDLRELFLDTVQQEER
jgi:hypothetical protein